jgi:hypothetical protein
MEHMERAGALTETECKVLQLLSNGVMRDLRITNRELLDAAAENGVMLAWRKLLHWRHHGKRTRTHYAFAMIDALVDIARRRGITVQGPPDHRPLALFVPAAGGPPIFVPRVGNAPLSAVPSFQMAPAVDPLNGPSALLFLRGAIDARLRRTVCKRDPWGSFTVAASSPDRRVEESLRERVAWLRGSWNTARNG